MRVIGATFSDRGDAERALAGLQETFEVGPNDASLAQLGSSADRGDLTLLAGRFPRERIQEVRRSIVSYGGKIVTDVDEAATRSRTTPPPASADGALGSQEALGRWRGCGPAAPGVLLALVPRWSGASPQLQRAAPGCASRPPSRSRPTR